MKSIEGITLAGDSTIKQALTIINTGGVQIAMVVGEEDKLIGTVTDGDIRRGLLSGLLLESSIESIIHKNPTVCSVGDSKEAILKIAVEKKLYQIPIVNSVGVLVGIAEVDELLKAAEFSNKVVLMVGGMGTRLLPLTADRPKPLLEVGNKPILETIINNFSQYGFKNIILSVNYKSQMIEEYFGDGSRFGVSIEYIFENKRLGTAGSLDLMREHLNEPFFVMNGDLLTNINCKYMLEYHLASQAVATMGIRKYDFQVPYGVVNIKNQLITSIEEKPVHKFFVSGGIYILNSEVLDYIPHDTFYDIPALFDTLIAYKQKTVSFLIKEYWLDIGRISDFERANIEYSSVFN